MMGSETEKPIHLVTLSNFKISKYEVTQAQYQAEMGNNPSYHKDCANCPVEQVSWEDIQNYINELNSRTGKTYRLPTMAEWEFAARGGNNSKGCTYSGSFAIDKVAWYADNSNSNVHPVGQKQPNELGIYDMSGNVNEWVLDVYDKDYYTKLPTNSSNPYRDYNGPAFVDYEIRFSEKKVEETYVPSSENPVIRLPDSY